MLDLFKDFFYIEGTPILKGVLPFEILKELDYFISRCREIKNHPLAELRRHRNAGKNSYQVSIPTNLLMDSFLLSFLIRMGELYIGVSNLENRNVRINNIENHHDGYDLWVNFSYKGDINPSHTHAGSLSGVIYYQNDGQETYFTSGPTLVGNCGDIIMFPSNFGHGVREKITDNERITLSFNLNVINN